MMRCFAACAAVALTGSLGIGAALAEEAPAAPSAPPARYTMVPAEGGFVRLDTRTGAVSHCRRESGTADAGWRCATIPEDELARPDRVGELDEQIEALSREVAALRMRVDELQRAAGPAAAPDALQVPPSDEEMNRALDFSEELMRRFFGLVREMKRQDGEDRT